MANTKTIGITGENTACAFLKKNGYKIIQRSYRCKQGEIDIIAKKRGLLTFVEVKARRKNSFGGPAAAVTKSKQKKITVTALNYIRHKNPKFKEISFDVIAIVTDEKTGGDKTIGEKIGIDKKERIGKEKADTGKIQHIKNAFTPDRFAF